MAEESRWSRYRQPVNTNNPTAMALEQGCQDLVRLSKEKERLERELGQVKTQMTKLEEEVLPDLMEKDQRKTFTSVLTGITLKFESMIFANIPKAESRDQESVKRRSRAFTWLEEKGFGRLISRELKVTFDKTQETEAKQLEASLRDQGLNLSRRYNVHPQSLNKFVRECLKEGIDVPMDVFGVFTKRTVKIKE